MSIKQSNKLPEGDPVGNRRRMSMHGQISLADIQTHKSVRMWRTERAGEW